MSSLVIKVGSLVIRTLSKPIANRIKAQAREHERFRRICVQTAQAIHRWDMRFKLGLLQDTATIEKQVAREAAEAQAKKHKHPVSTAKTEAQTIADETAAAKEKEKGKDSVKEPAKPRPKIRPLSEAKAIDSGANFVSETFLLLVGVALILGENWRQSRKASNRREDIAERLAELEEYEKSARRGMVDLEREVIRLRAKEGGKTNGPSQTRILPQKVWELEEREEAEERPVPETWLSWVRSRTGLAQQKGNDPIPQPSPQAATEPPSEPATEPTARTSINTVLDRILPTKKSAGGSDADRTDPAQATSQKSTKALEASKTGANGSEPTS